MLAIALSLCLYVVITWTSQSFWLFRASPVAFPFLCEPLGPGWTGRLALGMGGAWGLGEFAWRHPGILEVEGGRRGRRGHCAGSREAPPQPEL